MPAAKPPRLLSVASVEAILAAIPRSGTQPPEVIEGLRGWLGGVLDRALDRGKTKANALSLREVKRLGKAYHDFAKLVSQYQVRPDPPPAIPTSHGSTDWEHWLSGQIFAYRAGRPLSRDWRLIADLIALYEVTSSKTAFAKRAEDNESEGPTFRYLAVALDRLKLEAPSGSGIDFSKPHSESLRKQLPQIREFYVPWAKRSIDFAYSRPLKG